MKNTLPIHPSKPRRVLLWLSVRLLVLASLFMLIRLTSIAESLTAYFPSQAPFQTPPGFEDLAITTPDGKTLHAWFMRATDAQPGEIRPAILHCHGNAGNVNSHAAFSEFLTDSSMHVLIFDYRGYGRSTPSKLLRRSQLKTDALAAFDALAARADVDPNRIGIYGVSLGSAFALAVATERPTARAVCTVAAFSSWSDIAADKIPFFGRILMPTGLDPKDLATHLHTPYLIVHGDHDSIIPFAHAGTIEAAALAAKVPTTRYTAHGFDHNEEVPDSPASQQAIADFFTKSLAP